ELERPDAAELVGAARRRRHLEDRSIGARLERRRHVVVRIDREVRERQQRRLAVRRNGLIVLRERSVLGGAVAGEPRYGVRGLGRPVRTRRRGGEREDDEQGSRGTGYPPRASVSSASRRRKVTVLIGITLISRRSAAIIVRSVSPSTVAASAWRAEASIL